MYQTFYDQWCVARRLLQTDVGKELDRIGIKRFQFAKQILLCRQKKELYRKELGQHRKDKALDLKTAQNSRIQHRFYRDTKKPGAERTTRMVVISLNRIMGQCEDRTRKAWYYFDFIRYCMNAIGTRTKTPFPLIFAITSIFDLRPEPGICEGCVHHKSKSPDKLEKVCIKPSPIIHTSKRCPKLTIGSREISNYWSRQKN